jgi:hypothetical protein
MAQNNNILQELRELQSSLINASLQPVYHVPAGYFEGLAEQVMARIRALEAENALEELFPVLDTIPATMPLAVPAGYFDNLADQVLNRIKALESSETDELPAILSGISRTMPNAVPAGYFDGVAASAIESIKNESETPEEELATLSPLLGGLKKDMPYSIPEGYFEGLTKTVTIEAEKPQAKVISITGTRKKWLRYAAAAVITGFVAITGFLLINKNGKGSTQDTASVVKGVIKNVGTEEVDRFVQTIDEQSETIAQVQLDTRKANEIKELIKDIPEKDIQQFLDETQTGSGAEENEEDIFIN